MSTYVRLIERTYSVVDEVVEAESCPDGFFSCQPGAKPVVGMYAVFSPQAKTAMTRSADSAYVMAPNKPMCVETFADYPPLGRLATR